MLKVLIVDDKSENLYLLQLMLDTNGFKTISARNGAEALGLLRTNTLDLIITDILMPVMDGFTLCRECKKDKDLKNIPFFFYTATYTDAKDEEYALGLGADRFILKPQEPDDFNKIINDFFEEEKKKTIHPKKAPVRTETVVLKEYNEVLIRKIEDKILQNEKAEKELKRYAEVLEKEILERKTKEKSLLESQHLFQTLANVSPVGIFRTDSVGNTTYVNPKWTELSGISMEDALGTGWLHAVHPEDREKLSVTWSDKLKSKQESNAEYRFLKPDGTIVWVIGKAVPELIDNGVTGYIGTITDITDRKKVEKDLLESEEKFRSIMENSADAIFLTDMNGRYTYSNIAVSEMFGYSKSEILEKTILDLAPRNRINEYLEIFKSIPEKGNLLVEIELVKNDGTIVPVDLNTVVLTGNLIYGSCRDISERKKFEDELIGSKIKAEESDRLKSAFLHNISHEIRTPMNAIVGFSALLAEPDLEEGSKISFIDTITQSSNQLLAIINDIIEISNIEAGILKCSKVEIRVNLVLQRLYDQFYPIASGKGLQFVKHCPLPDNNDIFLTDKTKFIQIITNLLSNAFKFTSEGRIEFGYNLMDRVLHFYVSDTGIGFSEDQYQRIFDRFYQVERKMARHFEGTGLGLSISKAFVELMGGKIWVDSELGKGSVFNFTLPYNKTETMVPETSTSIQEISFNKRASILVAEDDEHNFILIMKFLSFPNITLIRANNGVEAVKYCESGQPVDLVLMDLKMPEMDGYEATKRIKRMKPDLPVIAQTAFVSDNEKAYNSGCDDIITKPFNRRSLLEMIGNYLKD